MRVNIATNIMAEHICQTIPQDFGAAGRSEIARARAVVRDLADRAAESLAFCNLPEFFGLNFSVRLNKCKGVQKRGTTCRKNMAPKLP